MKIKKYSVGGIAYTPFIPNQATANTTSTNDAVDATGGGSSASSKSSAKKAALQDDIVKLINQNGLPNDVNAFITQANSFLTKSQSLTGMTLFGGTDDEYSLSNLMKLQSTANLVKFNKEKYDSAVSNLNKENAWGEAAVTADGHLYCLSKDGLKKLSASEYAKDRDKYQLLSYSELLGLRESQAGMAMDMESLNAAGAAVGIDSVNKFIEDTIAKFGEKKAQGYTTKDTEIDRGFKALMENGPDGFYKATSLSKVNQEDIAAATNYILKAMPASTRKVFLAKMVADGGDPNSPQDAAAFIATAIHLNNKVEKSVDFDKSATEYDPEQSGKKGGSNPGDQLTEGNYLTALSNLRLDMIPGGVSLAPKGAKISDTGVMQVAAYDGGAVVDDNNRPIEMTNLEKLNHEAVALRAGDVSSATFGNRQLSPAEMSSIVYDGSSQMTVVMMPYKQIGGKTVPDFETLQKFNQLQRFLDSKPSGINSAEIAQQAEALGLDPSMIDIQGNQIVLTNTMAFLSFSAYAGDDTIKLSKEDKLYLEKVEKDEGKLIKDKYNNAVRYGVLGVKKGDRLYNDVDKSGANDFYRGNVFVPMSTPTNGMLLSGKGEYLPKGQFTDFAKRSAAKAYEVAQLQQARMSDPNYEQHKAAIGQFRN